MARMFLESAAAAIMNISPPSLIETLRSTASGQIPLLPYHLQRLRTSAKQLHYSCPLSEIKRCLLETANKNQGAEGRLRLLLPADGLFTVHYQPFINHYLSAQKYPLIALAAPTLQAPVFWRQHKTSYRPDYQPATAWLQVNPNYFDCIFLNHDQQLCEGSRSSIYLLLDGQWYTPPVWCGVLPGIQREILLQSTQVRERVLSLHDLHNAQGWRVSNALYGWLDVQFDATTRAL